MIQNHTSKVKPGQKRLGLFRGTSDCLELKQCKMLFYRQNSIQIDLY